MVSGGGEEDLNNPGNCALVRLSHTQICNIVVTCI